VRAACAPRASVVCCAKSMDVADARGMTGEQIDVKVEELKTELFHIRMKQATRQKYTPSDIRVKRKDIARLLTVKREKEIEQGISKRQSRKLEKARLAAEGMAL
jgi:large subunit ribosomal protein L29